MAEVVVAFAKIGGGTFRTPVSVASPYDFSAAIAAGSLRARNQGVRVANCLSIKKGKAVIFDPRVDLGWRKRGR